jgi:hypothetical protein
VVVAGVVVVVAWAMDGAGVRVARAEVVRGEGARASDARDEDMLRDEVLRFESMRIDGACDDDDDPAEADRADHACDTTRHADIPVDTTVPDDPDARWRAEFAVTAWLLGVDGTVGVRGDASRAHATFLDIIEATDSLFAFSGRVEVGRGRFTLFLDGMYSEAADENATGPLGIADVDITFKQTLLDFGAMYRLTPASGSADAVAIDAYAGGRYIWVSLEIEPAHRPRSAGDRGWTDPIVGARVAVPLGDGFRLAVNGDIGGFGAASDFTWSATALVAYDFAVRDTPASVMLGYRAVGWEHARGEGSGRFTWDVIQHGAMLGFALRF